MKDRQLPQDAGCTVLFPTGPRGKKYWSAWEGMTPFGIFLLSKIIPNQSAAEAVAGLVKQTRKV
jgi:hypothetical protein